MPDGTGSTEAQREAVAAKAREVLRLMAHSPDDFAVVVEGSEPEAASEILALVVTRSGTSQRRSYELAPSVDWAFELESDLKGGYFGPP